MDVGSSSADKTLAELYERHFPATTPVPSRVPGLKVPVVDDYISEIFQSRKQHYVKSTDIEKVITLVGQAHISVSYHRRHNILSRMTKDNKKA